MIVSNIPRYFYFACNDNKIHDLDYDFIRHLIHHKAPPLGGCPMVIILSVRQQTLTLCITFIVKDRDFIFGMSVSHDKTFPTVP